MGTVINRRRVCGGKSLPYDAEIEYLESTGTQYIDTGINISDGILVQTKLTFTNINSGQGYFGAQTSFPYNSNQISNDNRYLNVGFGTNTRTSYIITVGTKTIEYCSYKGNCYITVDGTTILSSLDIREYVSLNLYLFCINRNYASYILGSYCKIEYFKIFNNNNTLVRDFIPVRIGNVGYMYDKVSGQLFGNAGTGSFILGPDK